MDFVRAFSHFNRWLQRIRPGIRGNIKIRIEFERDDDRYYAQDMLKADLTHELLGYFDDRHIMTGGAPSTCYGIPFEFETRNTNNPPHPVLPRRQRE